MERNGTFLFPRLWWEGTEGRGSFQTLYEVVTFKFLESLKTPFPVIPSKDGIQYFKTVADHLDSGFHRSDDFYECLNVCFVRFRKAFHWYQVNSCHNISFMLHVYYVNVMKEVGSETKYHAES